jgi:hypothetical protein
VRARGSLLRGHSAGGAQAREVTVSTSGTGVAIREALPARAVDLQGEPVTFRTKTNPLLLLLTIGTGLTLVGDGHALPIFNAPDTGGEDCRWTGAFDGALEKRNGAFDGEAITVFVENDFAAEFALCGADALTQEQIEKQIQDAMEVWNREANGRVLIWGGVIDVPSEAGACQNVLAVMPNDGTGTLTPAVVVHGHSDPNGGTAASNIANCPGVTEVQFKMTKDPANSSGRFDVCEDAGTPKNKDWDNRRYNLASITGAMVHEFGHTLGLAHRHQTPSTGDGNSGQAVMSYENTTNDGDPRADVNNASDLHLWEWDKDCVDDVGTFGSGPKPPAVINERTVQPVYTNYPTAGMYSTPTLLPDELTKAWRSGGSGRTLSNATRYGLGFGSHMLLSGEIDQSNEHSFSTTHPTVSGFGFSDGVYSVAPIFFSMLENTTAQEQHRLNTLWVPLPQSGIFDPPVQVGSTHDGWFQNTENLSSTLYYVNDGGQQTLVQSHLPLMAAHDPSSGMTIFVRIDTTRVDQNATDPTSNQIFLHVSTDGSTELEGAGTSLQALNRPAYPNQPPAPNQQFSYDLKTATQPGIACADSSFDPPGPGDFNCMLAWKDLGSPDGHILYTHFRVEPNATNPVARFTFKNDVAILMRGGNEASTPSDISAAFFGDNFYVAYKGYATGMHNNAVHVLFGYSNSYSMDNGTNVPPSKGYVVGAPTWHYRATNHDKATTLSWTVDATL